MNLYSKYFSLIFFLLIANVFYSQEKPFYESPSVHFDNLMNVFANDGKHIYIVKFANAKGTSHNDLVVEKRELLTDKILFSTILPDYHKFQEKVRVPSSFAKCVKVKDKIYTFYEFINNKVDTMNVLLQIVDANTGVASQTLNVFKVFTKNNRTESIIEFSPDQSYFMVCANPQSPFVGFSAEHKFYIDMTPKLYNTSDIKLVWEKPVNKEVRYTSSKYRSLKIDNLGNLYTLYDEDEACVFNIFPNGSADTKLFPEALSLEKHCKNGTLFANKKGEIIFAGVFADKGKNAAGLFDNPTMFLRIINPASLSIYFSKDFAIENSVLAKLSITKSTKKEWSLRAQNDFLSFIVKEYEGGYYLITDHAFLAGDGWGSKTIKDIIIAKISTDGGVWYMKLIPRSNRGSWVELIHTEAYVISNKLVLLYSENPELAKSEIDTPNSLDMPVVEWQLGNIVIASEVEQGIFKKKVLFENMKGTEIFMSTYGVSQSFLLDAEKLVLPKENLPASTIHFTVYNLN